MFFRELSESRNQKGLSYLSKSITAKSLLLATVGVRHGDIMIDASAPPLLLPGGGLFGLTRQLLASDLLLA